MDSIPQDEETVRGEPVEFVRKSQAMSATE
jgi:hypothetical protein